MLTDLYKVEYGRLCAPVPTLAGPIDCCLPCPVTDWVYPDSKAISTQHVSHRKLTLSPRFLYPFKNCELAQCRRHRPVYIPPSILYSPSGTKDTSTLPYNMLGRWRHGDGGKLLLMDCLESMSSSLQMTTLVPLGARPSLCHDAITPNDMKSDLACAWSGSLQVFGGFAAVMWSTYSRRLESVQRPF